MSAVPIIPAVIPRSGAELIEFTKTLHFSHELHVDVIDGKFVPTVSWPYEPHGEVMSVKGHTDSYTLEVDLMVTDPIQAARAWIKAGADMLVFHVETIDLASFIDFATHEDVSVGISFSGDTPLEAIFPYLQYADYVQVMGIHLIGSQGQPFDTTVLDTIKALDPLIPISVDGSINKETILRVVKAGADRLIVGSAIVKQTDPEAAYNELLTLIAE